MIIGNYGGEIWRNHILYYIPMISALFPYIYIENQYGIYPQHHIPNTIIYQIPQYWGYYLYDFRIPSGKLT